MHKIKNHLGKVWFTTSPVTSRKSMPEISVETYYLREIQRPRP